MGKVRFRGLLIGAAVCMLAACLRVRPHHPSHDELAEAGFHVYVLPQGEAVHRDWMQDISIWSFTRHCEGLTATEQHNPLYVYYRDRNAENAPPVFSVEVGPWAPPWGLLADGWHSIELPFEGGTVEAEYRKGQKTESNEFLGIRFSDSLGIPVYVGSRLSLEETSSLIGMLSYVGPPKGEFVNPWECSFNAR